MVGVVAPVDPGDVLRQREMALISCKRTCASELPKQTGNLGIHLLVVDLFSPRKRDPEGMRNVIRNEFVEADFELPAGKQIGGEWPRTGLSICIANATPRRLN
jgi:hypothetical protein